MTKCSAPIASLLFLSLIFFLNQSANATIITKTVEYSDGNTVLEGKVAYDSANVGLRPGILVVHEWTGLGTYVTARIQKLAKLGYIAFAADITAKEFAPPLLRRPEKRQAFIKIIPNFCAGA
jgi:dienelactone hydrolase